MTNAIALRGKYKPPTAAQIDSVVDGISRGLTLGGACARAGVRLTTIRSRMERDSGFAERIEEAKANFHSVVIQELARRGIHGVERAVYYQGEIIGTERAYSDKLLLRLADIIPEYSPAKKVEHSGTIEHVAKSAEPISREFLRSLPPEQQIHIRKRLIDSAFAAKQIDRDRRFELLADLATDADEWNVKIPLEELAALPSVIDGEFTPVTTDDASAQFDINEICPI